MPFLEGLALRIATLAALTITLAALLLAGCDSGSDYYGIDGDYNVGTVRFVYGGNQTWTLRECILTVDTSAGELFFSGLDSDGLLWGYSGDYQRSNNRLVALDMPEVDFGSEDQLDLRIEFTSNSRFEGVAINWVYDSGELTDVGAANITGRETFIAAAQAREVEATGSDAKTSKQEVIE